MEHFVLLQRSNIASGMRTVGKSVGFFLYPFTKRQAIGLLVCVSSNARKDQFRSPEQHLQAFFVECSKNTKQ